MFYFASKFFSNQGCDKNITDNGKQNVLLYLFQGNYPETFLWRVRGGLGRRYR